MSDPLAFETQTPRLALPLLFAGQAQKEFIVNEALTRAAFAIQAVVEGEAAMPPALPEPGQAWLVGASPGGAFADRAGAIAGWTAGGWRYIAAVPGMRVFDRSAGCFRHFTDSWHNPAAPLVPGGGGTIDAEARATIVNLIEALVAAGVFATN